MLGRFNDFVELDDIGVPDQFEDVYLSGDAFDISYFSYFAFLEYFYGHVLIGWLMECGFDLAEGALSDCLACMRENVPMR